MKSDIEIAREAVKLPIVKLAEQLGIDEEDLEYYGRYKAKLPLSLLNEKQVKQSQLILVTAISPTPTGEGKTTTSVGLNEGLNKLGKKAIAVLREPSLGPVFGMKGGAAGGGYAQVVPMEDLNLHFTGDFAAIEKANNLLAALIDNNLQNKKYSLGIDPRTIVWKRVMDMNDRSLRHITIGLGGSGNGVPREDGFNITAASEIMAILCMAQNLSDLKERIGNIYIGLTWDGQPVYAKDLKAEEAMTILLRDAIKPNLVQTLENNPVLIHGGPFANIAQGTNTILATKMGMSLADYVVTEAGFGADLGAEKFLHLKCRVAGFAPAAVVLVATIRALRHHGGAKANEYRTPNLEKVKIGFLNLKQHIENMQKFGYQPVVAINAFPGDSDAENNFVVEACQQMGCNVAISHGFAKGGEGCVDLANAVLDELSLKRNHFKPICTPGQKVKEQIETIAKEIYRADDVQFSNEAIQALKNIEKLGLQHLPVCMAKTQKSFSDQEHLLNAPRQFSITIRGFEFARGAGFIIPILGQMMRMPGLPNIPASEGMSINENGELFGLS